jgi:hypothetical protein
MLPHLLMLNFLIIVFGGGSRRGGCGSECLFWMVVSVGITIFINVVLILIYLLVSGPRSPGVNV